MPRLVAFQIAELVQAIAGPGQRHQRRQERRPESHALGVSAENAAQFAGQEIPSVQESLQGREGIRLRLSLGAVQDPQAEVQNVVRRYRQLLAQLPIDHSVALVVPEDVLAAEISVGEDRGKGLAESLP